MAPSQPGLLPLVAHGDYGLPVKWWNVSPQPESASHEAGPAVLLFPHAPRLARWASTSAAHGIDYLAN